MVRKLALAVSLALGTLSVPAHALGLGELNSKSTLNQNFQGDIALLSVGPDEIGSVRVKLADAAAFERAGVERPFYLSLLKFEPIIAKRGKPVVRVTSEFPIREPFLNFLIEVNWPKGRLLREYTVLLDPPTTTTRKPPVVTPAARTARPAAEPVKAKPTASAPARTQPTPVSKPAVSSRASLGSEYGPVKANDTAWRIAKKVRPSGVSMEQMMMALLEANPQAFIRNDINLLKRGRILRVPSLAEIQQLSRAQARAAYRQQQDAWLARRDAKLQQAAQAPQTTTEKKPADTTAEAAAEAEAAADQLRIATARPQGEGEAGAGDDDAVSPTASDIKARLIAARENAETSRQEAEVLRSRVDDLQARLQDMQKLLSLKDDQLAQLQDNVITQESAAATEPAEAAVPVTGDASVADEVILDNEVNPDAGVREAADSAEARAAPKVAGTPADSVVEPSVDVATTESQESAEALAQAIDNAVADLVGDSAPVTEDYVIQDIGPQIDPDRIVLEAETAETPAPVVEAQAATGELSAGDLDIPPQIDPDRIVLGLDSAPAQTAGEADVTIDVAADQPMADDAGAEVVIEGVGDAPAMVPEPPAPVEAAAVDVPAGTLQESTPSAEQATATDGALAGILPPAMAKMVEQNMVPIAVGGVAVLGLFGWLATRGRRKQDQGEEQMATAGAGAAGAEAMGAAVDEQPAVAAVDEPILNPDALDDLPDSSFLDDFSPSDINALQDETGEVDPVSEADVYIAYGRYQQAEELLKQAMERDPDRLALKHKLLEVHYATRDSAAFAALAQQMVDAGQDSADEEAWSRAQDMGRELDSSNPLFAAGERSSGFGAGGVAAAAAVAGAAASVADADSVDSDSLSLEDMEISELTAAYDEETSALSELDPPSEVSIELDLDDASELIQPNEPMTSPDPIALEDVEPLEFEMPDAESSGDAEHAGSVDAISDTLDLDSMMAEAEAAVDQDNSSLNLDSDFSAAELQAQLDELSDLSALDSDLDDDEDAAAGTGVGLVSEDAGAAPTPDGLDQPLSLDTAFDAADEDDGLETLDLDDSEPSSGDEDEVATKLDLATAYVEMGDQDGARNILEEVVLEGSEGQRSEAEKLLAELG